MNVSSEFETRGHCPQCVAWFVIPDDTVQALVRSKCPTCSAAFDDYENRCGDLRIALSIATPPVAAPLGTSTR
ncbi:MAG TPA: hypothetical protein VM307_16085 [Egibacteraceae bacterium]|nr:hypothetical protein [Egibacteraceae bacterium]